MYSNSRLLFVPSPGGLSGFSLNGGGGLGLVNSASLQNIIISNEKHQSFLNRCDLMKERLLHNLY